MDMDTSGMTNTVNLREELESVGIEEILTQLDRELKTEQPWTVFHTNDFVPQ